MIIKLYLGIGLLNFLLVKFEVYVCIYVARINWITGGQGCYLLTTVDTPHVQDHA